MNYAYQAVFDEGYRKGYEDGMKALQERIVSNMIENAEVIKSDVAVLKGGEYE